MFDLDEQRDRIRVQKLENAVMPKVDCPTSLYTKKFTKSEWDKLENIVIDGLGYGKSVQDVIKEKYNVEIVEETKYSTKKPIKDFNYKQLERTLKAVLKADKENSINAIKMKKKFLIYAGDSNLADQVRKFHFINLNDVANGLYHD